MALTIIGGRAARRRIEAPPGQRTRPTTARVREALFSSVIARLGSLQGAHVLDAFAGSGALGLEAWSRGAERVVFAEAHRRTARVVRANIERLDATPDCHLITRPMPRALDHLPDGAAPFDLALLDPPWDEHALLRATLEALRPHLAPGALIVAEQRRDDARDLEAPPGLEVVDERCYASTALIFIEIP